MLDTDREVLRELSERVHAPMLRVMKLTRERGGHVELALAHMVPGRPPVPTMRLDISASPHMMLAASFQVRWERGWRVHRLMFERVGDGFRRVRTPVECFEVLPDAEWFDRQLEAFLEHECRVGLLQPH